MAIYAIGDIQGCYDDLQRLLSLIEFNPEDDKLWFAGDLVNRGPQSLEVIRFIKSLGERAISVLGNHDLHLLALSQGNRSHYKHGTLEDILHAPDHIELIEWLRHRPLMYHNKKRGYSLVHAGLPPPCEIAPALKRSAELEATLRGPGFHHFCQVMYGNDPDIWSDNLTGIDRLRFITNCFTRVRFCTQDGRLALKEKGAPGSQNNGTLPWFKLKERASRNSRILFGHWSTLGYYVGENVWSLDTGCLWGGKLTALKLSKKYDPKPIHMPCQGYLRPGRS
jgi:bis(5'-nucleosyl)-tetraphosphatase (symmetrical)